ncbi:hypothetical protein RRF57_013085 [Xylaria bambusicola]|uniref:Uncharacterized protein n=1 Tax=Xylaria bambusicola TaxID=326684 RepID=A0AAN7ZFB6_9PEZI
MVGDILLTQELGTLLRASALRIDDGDLNIAMRELLRQYAAEKSLRFEQDSAGNVYLSRPSNDDTLANIAIAFPIDAQDSSRWFKSAFSAFDLLGQDDVHCGVTLMGFTSLRGENVGLQAWENAVAIPGKPAAPSTVPLLDQFSNSPSPTTFPFSAIFQPSESTDVYLSLTGNSILIAKAEKALGDQEGLRVCTQEFRRAPRLQVEGLGAAEVTRKLICAYSEYVVALFDNFE